MIPKQKLRIGNKVMINGQIVTVKAIEHNSVNDKYYVKVYEDFRLILTDYLDPIPITEEALVKMGFECDSREALNYIYKFNNFSYYPNSKEWYYKWNKIEIDFIHQLQNIIYFLTKTELSYD